LAGMKARILQGAMPCGNGKGLPWRSMLASDGRRPEIG
jgi:hypothetical protein